MPEPQAVSSIAGSTCASVNVADLVPNGGFESGSFAPWTANVTGATVSWDVSSTGATVQGPAITVAPQQGSQVAVFSNFSPSRGVLLSSPFTVPPGNSAVSVALAYKNGHNAWVLNKSNPLTAQSQTNQWLRVDVIRGDSVALGLDKNDIAATLFDSQVGAPPLEQLTYLTVTKPLSVFEGKPVRVRVMAVDTFNQLAVWVDDVKVACV